MLIEGRVQRWRDIGIDFPVPLVVTFNERSLVIGLIPAVFEIFIRQAFAEASAVFSSIMRLLLKPEWANHEIFQPVSKPIPLPCGPANPLFHRLQRRFIDVGLHQRIRLFLCGGGRGFWRHFLIVYHRGELVLHRLAYGDGFISGVPRVRIL